MEDHNPVASSALDQYVEAVKELETRTFDRQRAALFAVAERMAKATRGAYFFVGTGSPAGNTPICHHPDFDFDDRIIPTAMAMFLGLVRDRIAAP